jgi:cytochrome c5
MKWRLGNVWSVGSLLVLALLGAPLAMPVAAQIGRGVARPKVLRPTDAVWQVIRTKCTACHGIDDYAFFALDRAGWQALIKDKHKGDGDGVDLSPQDENTLLDWLVLKFGPDSKPFPRAYVPPEISTFFSDPEAKRLLDKTCTTCHSLERVQQARHPDDAWRVIVLDMRERGATIADDDLERLAEWLGRVWGTNQDK